MALTSRVLPALLALVPLAAGSAAAAPIAARSTSPAAAPAAAKAPALSVQTVAGGLNRPWDIAWIDSTRYLLTELSGRLWLGSTAAGVPLRRVTAAMGDISAQLPGGLMGLAIDPGFASNRTFYTCQSNRTPKDVRVIRWRLAANGASATRVGSPVITGIPVVSMHFGCRLLFTPDGRLMIGTGDGAIGDAPQSLDNLAGKILRVNRDGTVPADNPWARSTGARKYVWNYGHRNVQGLALRPGTSQVFSTEHGPDRDDEFNRVLKARNYGWNPVDPSGSGAYNQDVPMTDLVKYPNAVPALWSSGSPTVATSGLGFVSGAAWGSYANAALVAELKGAGVLALSLNAAGAVTGSAQVSELKDVYGRIRTVRQAPDGSLYVLTSNAGQADRVLRVRPAG